MERLWNPDVALLDPCYPLAETGACKREGVTLPKTDIAIRIGGWETTFHLGRPIFRCYVSFGEGRCIPRKSSHLHFFRQNALRRCVAIQTRDIKQGLESGGEPRKNPSICGESFVPNLNWVVLRDEERIANFPEKLQAKEQLVGGLSIWQWNKVMFGRIHGWSGRIPSGYAGMEWIAVNPFFALWRFVSPKFSSTCGDATNFRF